MAGRHSYQPGFDAAARRTVCVSAERREPALGARPDDAAQLERRCKRENREKRDENLRLLYVACTRAMELLVIPDFTWCDEKSWAKQLDFGLDDIPELDVSKLRRAVVAAPKSSENRQSAEVFAEEQSRIERGFPPIAWTKPSESDPDVLPTQPRIPPKTRRSTPQC